MATTSGGALFLKGRDLLGVSLAMLEIADSTLHIQIATMLHSATHSDALVLGRGGLDVE